MATECDLKIQLYVAHCMDCVGLPVPRWLIDAYNLQITKGCISTKKFLGSAAKQRNIGLILRSLSSHINYKSSFKYVDTNNPFPNNNNQTNNLFIQNLKNSNEKIMLYNNIFKERYLNKALSQNNIGECHCSYDVHIVVIAVQTVNTNQNSNIINNNNIANNEQTRSTYDNDIRSQRSQASQRNISRVIALNIICLITLLYCLSLINTNSFWSFAGVLGVIGSIFGFIGINCKHECCMQSYILFLGCECVISTIILIILFIIWSIDEKLNDIEDSYLFYSLVGISIPIIFVIAVITLSED